MVIESSPLEGIFTLTYENAKTSPIELDATASQLVTKLQSLNTINQIEVNRSEPDAQGLYQCDITFKGPLHVNATEFFHRLKLIVYEQALILYQVILIYDMLFNLLGFHKEQHSNEFLRKFIS